MKQLTYNKRVESVRAFVARLFDDFEATVASVVADGWPEAMVRAGFELHRKTWNVDQLARAFEAELAAVGGVNALERAVKDGAGGRLRAIAPASIAHIWPALPGSGLTPVLFGALLGIPQRVRPSSRGRHFAARVVACWDDELPALELVEPGDSWQDADVVVVSGSDETVAEVRRQAPGAIVTGYGHRVSFAVVVDGDGVDLADVAARTATDAVMWHQSGCFSARAVLFWGAEERLEAFGERLGEAIAAKEERLDAAELGQAELAQRAQARGVAEFTSTLWGDGVGWAQRVDGPFAGERVAAHVVTLHSLSSIGDLHDAIVVPAGQLQGVALEASAEQQVAWAEALCELGVTRVCRAGELQAPPAGWLHDGRPNVLGWLRVVLMG